MIKAFFLKAPAESLTVVLISSQISKTLSGSSPDRSFTTSRNNHIWLQNKSTKL